MQNTNRPLITIEEMITEGELFQSVYSELIQEIERGEHARGKLNEFQLMQAVAHAKNGLGVLSFERRQTINAIFETFTSIYLKDGRAAAEEWAQQSFGCSSSSEKASTAGNTEVLLRIKEISRLIQEKETELLQFYREFYMLERYLAQD
jgi:hypothetical protein